MLILFLPTIMRFCAYRIIISPTQDILNTVLENSIDNSTNDMCMDKDSNITIQYHLLSSLFLL